MRAVERFDLYRERAAHSRAQPSQKLLTEQWHWPHGESQPTANRQGHDYRNAATPQVFQPSTEQSRCRASVENAQTRLNHMKKLLTSSPWIGGIFLLLTQTGLAQTAQPANTETRDELIQRLLQRVENLETEVKQLKSTPAPPQSLAASVTPAATGSDEAEHRKTFPDLHFHGLPTSDMAPAIVRDKRTPLLWASWISSSLRVWRKM